MIAFPSATGRGLNIAVIDSGVNLRHPHIFAPTRGVEWDAGAISSGDQTWEDTIGHGTAVMAAIQEAAPEANYHAIKLFGNSLRSSSPQLMKAIEWAIDNEMDIVNLSLGTPNFDYRSEMQALVDRAEAAGVVLVSARSSGASPVLPGSLERVISVDVDWDLARARFRVNASPLTTPNANQDSPFFFASGFPRSLPGVPPARNLNGVSFAVANMAGFAARACEQHGRGFAAVHAALVAEAQRLEVEFASIQS